MAVETPTLERPAAPVFLDDGQVELFWSKVDKSRGHGPWKDCWVWTAGQKNPEGYGGFYVRQVDNTVTCHKLAFLIAHNFGLHDLPKGVVVRHLCNNPQCVRPDHLAIGTHKDNSQDMVKAGNSIHGEKNWRCSVTAETVYAIRADWMTGGFSQTELAKKYDTTLSVVQAVVTNRTWKDPNYTPPTHSGKRHKFSSETIEQVKRMKADGKSLAEITAATGVKTSQIYNIVSGRQRRGV